MPLLAEFVKGAARRIPACYRLPPSMTHRRLRILCVSHLPPSPPRFGAQARVHGLWTALARRHDLTAVTLLDPEFDAAESERALRAYCREVLLLADPHGGDG